MNNILFPRQKIKDECGIFAVHLPGKKVSEVIFYALQTLQHRGQESAGIAVSDGEDILVFKDLGLVSQVFGEKSLVPLQGFAGIGHTRYSTRGKNIWKNSQPIYKMFNNESFAIAHNGNLTNAEELRKNQIAAGVKFDTTTDSEVIASLIENSEKDNIEDAIKAAVGKLRGSFSLVILTKNKVFVIVVSDK